MLECTKGIKGKKIRMINKLTNKSVTFRLGSEPDVSLTKEEEDWFLKRFDVPGWEIKRVKAKIEKPIDKGGG